MKPAKATEALKDASHLYEVEHRAYHLERPGFRISELRLSPTQTVPWHCHSHDSDTFYVIEGQLRLFLQNPKQDIRLFAIAFAGMIVAALLVEPWWTLAVICIGYLALMPYSIMRYARIKRQRAASTAPAAESASV